MLKRGTNWLGLRHSLCPGTGCRLQSSLSKVESLGVMREKRAFITASFPLHPSLYPKPSLPSPWRGGKLGRRAPVSSACNGPGGWAGTSIKDNLKLVVEVGEGGEAQMTVWPCVHWEQRGHGFGLCQIQLAFLFKLALCLKQVQIHFPCKVRSTA